MRNSFVDEYDALVLRYEDLCANPNKFLVALRVGLSADFLVLPDQNDVNKVACTGKSGRATLTVGIRKRQHNLIDQVLKE